MFDLARLYEKPLIQMRKYFIGDLPEHFIEMYSSQFWYHIDSGFIDKIVAMRVYPYQNCIALKFRPRDSAEFVSVLLKEPQLRILKIIWDCGHLGFNYAIKYYLIYSQSASRQWIANAQHSKNCIEWYLDITAGENNG